MSLRGLLVGFVAGAVAVLVFHQGMILILHLLGQTPNFPWSLRPVGPLRIPAIANSMFWGGLWGVLFALIGGLRPSRSDLLRGVGFGLLGPWLLGNGVLVPLARGGQLLFGLPAGQVMPLRLLIGALIAAAFGLGLAVMMRLLRRWA